MDLDCLQSLVFFSNGSNQLFQLLGKAPQLQQMVVRLKVDIPDEVALLSALSLLPHLRFVNIRFSSRRRISDWPHRAILTFLRGPLRANLTFCRFDYRIKVPESLHQMQNVMTEMLIMTQTQKLVAGAVCHWLVRRGCPLIGEWTGPTYTMGFFAVPL